MAEYFDAAIALHKYLVENHWTGAALAGPDPGIRFNARIGRFVKSYLPFISWSDDLVYMQGQAYWVMDNWLLADVTGEARYRELAVATSEHQLELQTEDGYWPYPNPEWSGRIATVEGSWASLSLLASYASTQRPEFLTGAVRWYDYLVNSIGFRNQDSEDLLAINYFAGNRGTRGGVPNNSSLVLWLIASLNEATGDDRYLEYAAPMVRWLNKVQTSVGELPYLLETDKRPGWDHFLCYQYNAFEFIDLAHYRLLTGDSEIDPVLERLSEYLAGGVVDEGYARYDCNKSSIEVPYYTAAVAQALSQATQMGLGNYGALVDRAYRRLLQQQRPDGGFEFYSKGNYRVLSDRRSYPRYLAMILNHLLLEDKVTRPT